MAGMGFLGALSGVGKGTADVGETLLKSSLAKEQQAERDERAARIEEYKAGAASAASSAKYERERQDKEKDYAQKRKDELADLSAEQKNKLEQIRLAQKLKGDGGDGEDGGGTNSKKRYNELLGLGVPSDAARGVAYGTYKSVSDPATGSTMVVDMASGKEVGRMTPIDPAKPLGALRWTPSAEQPPSPPTKADLDAAAERMNKESGRDADWIPGNEYGPKDPEVIKAATKGRVEPTPSTAPSGSTQTLGISAPKGIPAGSKQIGTSKGKPVYEAPNGKRYIVE